MEMDNSLQYQIYEQLRLLNSSVQDISRSQAQESSYKSFSNSFSDMQMQYAQSTMHSQPGFVGPATTYNNLASTQQGLLAAQAEGLYNGLGITPQMRQFAQQNLMAPAAAFAGTQAAYTGSLVGNVGAAMFTNPTLGMTAQAKQMYATNLAANAASAATSVAGGLGTVAGGAASLAAFGALAGGTIALGPLALGAAALWGTSKLMTSNTVNVLTGGKFGGMDPRIFKPVQYIKDQIEEEKNIKNFLSENAYKFISHDALDGHLGFNLGLNSKNIIADSLRGMDKKVLMPDDEIQSLFSSFVNSGIIRNVTDFEKMMDDFGENLEFVKKAKVILGKSSDEIADLMAEFQKTGIGVKNFDVLAADLMGYASMLQMDVDTVAAYGLGATIQRTAGTTLDAGKVFKSSLMEAALVTDFYDTYKDTDKFKLSMQFIENLPDKERGAADVLWGAVSSMFSPESFATNASAAFLTYAPDTKSFIIDQNKLKKYKMMAESGELTTNALAGEGARYLTNLMTYGSREESDAASLWNKHTYNALRSMDDLSSTTELLNVLKDAVINQSGGRIGDIGAVSHIFGIGDTDVSRFLTDILEHADNLSKDGVSIEDKLEEVSKNIQDQTEKEVERLDNLHKNFHKSTHILEHIFEYTAQPILRFFEKYILNKIGIYDNLDTLFTPAKYTDEDGNVIDMKTGEAVSATEGPKRSPEDYTEEGVYAPLLENSNTTRILTEPGILDKLIPFLTDKFKRKQGATELSDLQQLSPDGTLGKNAADVLNDTNDVATVALRITEKHTEILQTYMKSLEKDIALVEGHLMRANNNPVAIAAPSVSDAYKAGRFIRSSSYPTYA